MAAVMVRSGTRSRSKLASDTDALQNSCLFVLIRGLALLLLFIGGNLGQGRRQQAFFLFFLIVERKAGWGNHSRGYENDQVLFGVLLGIGAKGSADKRNIADDG